MIRGLFITGVVLALAYMVGSIFMVIYVGDLRHSYYASYDYSYDNSSSRPHVAATRMMGALNALAFFFYVFLFIYGMVKARISTTVLVMGILGLLFTAIAMLFDLVMVMDARHISFDEIGPAFAIWAFFMMAFTIPCAILTGARQLEELKQKKEMQKMMFANPYQWPGQNPYYNPNPQNQQQQQYTQQNYQQQYGNAQPNFNPQHQNPQQHQQNTNPYQYFNPYNPTPPPPPPVNPPDNKS